MLWLRDRLLELVKFLIDQGVDVTVKRGDGKTALMFASIGGKLKEAEYLVGNGADINSKDNQGHAALWYAEFFMHGV